jgi:hypothetical protein
MHWEGFQIRRGRIQIMVKGELKYAEGEFRYAGRRIDTLGLGKNLDTPRGNFRYAGRIKM